MLDSTDLLRRRDLTSESNCFVFAGSLVSKGKRVSERRQSAWSRKWLLMARVKLAGVGADLPVLQPEARAQKARRSRITKAGRPRMAAVVSGDAWVLRTIFIASPVDSIGSIYFVGCSKRYQASGCCR